MNNNFTRTIRNIRYSFKSRKKLSAEECRYKTKGLLTILGFFLVAMQVAATIFFIIEAGSLDMFPLKYVICGLTFIFVILIYDFISQFTKAHIIGKIFAVLMSAILIYVSIAGVRINNAYDKITSEKVHNNTVDILVMNDSPLSNISDTFAYTYGYNDIFEGPTINKALQNIEAENSVKINTQKYDSWKSLADALYSNEISVIAISDQELRAMGFSDSDGEEEEDNNVDLESYTKIIGTIDIEQVVSTEVGEIKDHMDPFIIYISGNDDYGQITSIGRSDVNILAVVNPESRQVLLVSTPRDYRILMTRTFDNGSTQTGYDKLTHAGVSATGIRASMDALENLYGINIDYYYKINFDGCVSVVDALGGITINSDVEFTNGEDAAPIHYHFVVGENECDGEKTLAFVRERQVFAAGDLQRGKDQQAAITAMINKATSPAILTSYNSVLNAVSDMMLTNMPLETISNLVKDQLNDSTPWTVQSYELTYQTGGSRPLQLYATSGWCEDPDYDSINIAIKLINRTLNDDVYNVEEYVDELNGKTPVKDDSANNSDSSDTSESSNKKSSVSAN